MKTRFSLLIAVTAWIAVVTQYYLLLENRTTTGTEATIRFLSFFTILTNTMVALFFALAATIKNKARITAGGNLTALTVYIAVVGLIYQIALRHTWSPTGLQKVVDELLHSVIPLLVILFWWIYEEKQSLNFNRIPSWLIYPSI